MWTVDDEVKLGINDLVELGEHLFQGAALRCPVFYLVDAKLDLDPPRGFYIAVRRSVETPKELEYHRRSISAIEVEGLVQHLRRV